MEKRESTKRENDRPCGDFPLTAKLSLLHVVDKCQCVVSSLQINCLSSCKSATQPRAQSH